MCHQTAGAQSWTLAGSLDDLGATAVGAGLQYSRSYVLCAWPNYMICVHERSDLLSRDSCGGEN